MLVEWTPPVPLPREAMAMPIPVRCPNAKCGKSLNCPDEYAGRVVQCPACHQQMQVPPLAAAAQPPPQAAAPMPPQQPAPEPAQALPATPDTRSAHASAGRARRKPQSKAGLWIGMVVASALVVAGGVYAVLQSGKGKQGATQSRSAKARQPKQSSVALRVPERERKLAEMYAYAEKYAEEHPTEFAEILRKFGEVHKNSEDTVYSLRASDQLKVWGAKQEKAAQDEMGKRREQAQELRQAGDLEKVETVWKEFPESLLCDAVKEEVMRELAHAREVWRRLFLKLNGEAGPLLAKQTAELSPEEFLAFNTLRDKVQDACEKAEGEAVDSLNELLERVDQSLGDYEAAAAAERQEQFDKFWRRYQGLVEGKDFKGAADLCAKASAAFRAETAAPGTTGSDRTQDADGGRGPGIDAATYDALAEDSQVLTDLMASARKNLPKLVGKTVRIAGMSVKVTRADGDNLYAKQGGAEVAFGIEKLDTNTLLSLGLESQSDAKAAARAKALLVFHFGSAADALASVQEANEAAVDISFYQERLAPVLIVTTTPARADLEVFEEAEDGSWQKIEKPLRSPLRMTVAKNTTYRIEVSKAGYRSERQEVTTEEGGESRLKPTLRRAGLPGALRENFELPDDSKDRHGNRVRAGYDRWTGLPLEIVHEKTRMPLVFIPPGEFMMGSPPDEQGRSGIEGPQHAVSFSNPFYMGKYEVTQGELKSMLGITCGRQRGLDNPVDQIDRGTCKRFITELNETMGGAGRSYVFSLPSEAQWEYACRAGTTTRYSFGDDPNAQSLPEHAWFNNNSERKLHPVGQKKPNGWGLYDMHGSILEWCEDIWHANYEGAPSDGSAWSTDGNPDFWVSRGGLFGCASSACRSASRWGSLRSMGGGILGFRLVLSIPQPEGTDGEVASGSKSTTHRSPRPRKRDFKITLINPRGAVVGEVKTGEPYGIDRPYSFAKIPRDLRGAPFAKYGAGCSVWLADGSHIFVSKPCNLCVAVLYQLRGQTVVTNAQFKAFNREGWSIATDALTTRVGPTTYKYHIMHKKIPGGPVNVPNVGKINAQMIFMFK